MPVIGPSLSRAHLRTREDGGWWSRQHLIKFQIFLCRDGGPCFWMSLGLTISSIPLTLRCFRCRLFRLQSWCPSTSSPTLALSCGRHLSALRRVWRILDSGGLINTGMFVEIRIFYVPMEREASCGVGRDAIAESPLGVPETLEVGPKKGKRTNTVWGLESCQPSR